MTATGVSGHYPAGQVMADRITGRHVDVASFDEHAGRYVVSYGRGGAQLLSQQTLDDLYVPVQP
jgi:hypothetical protein